MPLKGNKRVKWKGVDPDGEPSTGRYAVFFHPLNTDPIISKPNGESEEKQFGPPSKQPAGVDYKYTVARLDDNSDILTSCSPLDPRIRVLR